MLVRSFYPGDLKSGTCINRSSAAYWDGKNEAGKKVARGIYYYTIDGDSFSATRKMVVAK